MDTRPTQLLCPPRGLQFSPPTLPPATPHLQIPSLTFGALDHSRSSCRSPSRVTHIPCSASFTTRHYRDALLRNHFIRGLFLAHRMNHFMTAPLLGQTTHIKHIIRRPGIQLDSQWTPLVFSISRHTQTQVHTLFFPVQHLLYALHTIV